MRHVIAEDLDRTRRVLAELAARQEHLGVQLASVSDFTIRSDWLIAHRTPDEQLAWDRRWRQLPKKRSPRMTATPKRQPKLTADQVFEELDWLFQNGATAWEAAEALKRSPESLERLAHRHGRRDLAAAMNTERAA